MAPPNAKLLVDYGWVVKEEDLLRGRCSVLVDQFNWALKQLFRQLPGVGNGGGTADELRPRPVEITDALYPSEHVGHVRPEDSTVGMKLVDDDVPQVLKELDPLGMVGKDARMEHIRIGDYDVPMSPNRLASILGGIPIVGEGSDGVSHGIDKLLKFSHLILGERLCWEEVDSLNGWIAQLIVEDGEVITEGFSRSRGRDHHDILSPAHCLESIALMREEPGYPPLLEGPHQSLVDEIGDAYILTLPPLQPLRMGYAGSNVLRGTPPLDDLFDGHPQNLKMIQLNFLNLYPLFPWMSMKTDLPEFPDSYRQDFYNDLTS